MPAVIAADSSMQLDEYCIPFLYIDGIDYSYIAINAVVSNGTKPELLKITSPAVVITKY